MRRVRRLDQCDYIVPLSMKSSQVLTLSNQSNVLLERTWDQDSQAKFDLHIHAKFDSAAMNGIMIMSTLLKNNRSSACVVNEFKIYLVNESDWSETLIDTVSALSDGHGVFYADIGQIDLSPIELSGREVFAVECVATRRRKSYRKKVWFNHLGCYDHLIRLRHAVEYLESAKADE